MSLQRFRGFRARIFADPAMDANWRGSTVAGVDFAKPTAEQRAAIAEALGAGDGDILIVPTAAEPVRYTKKDGKWGRYEETVTEVNGRKVKTSKWKEGGTVGVGQGFWRVK